MCVLMGRTMFGTMQGDDDNRHNQRLLFPRNVRPKGGYAQFHKITPSSFGFPAVIGLRNRFRATPVIFEGSKILAAAFFFQWNFLETEYSYFK